MFRTRGTFRTLSNIYYGEFYSEPCITLAYLKPWRIQNPRHIHNTVIQLSWNILLKTFCNPDIFRTIVYSQLWYTLKSKHIQSPVEYLRESILLRTLCKYSKIRRPVYSKLFVYSKIFAYLQPECVSYSLMYQLLFRTTNLLLLLYPLLFIKSMTYSLRVHFFSDSLVYELQSSY